MRKTRTFVAVDLSPSVRKRAGDLIQRLQPSGARVSWVVPENMHITLKFLGDQGDGELAVICDAVIAAARALAPFPFTCRGAGAFPNVRRPRTLWIGVGDGAEAMRRLHAVVEDKLAEHGYRKERRAFHPHLTLGRVRSGGAAVEELGQRIQQARDFPAGEATASEVLVYGSFLQRTGPRYDVLARAPLCGEVD